MTAAAFLQQLDDLAAQSDWQGILDLCDMHYDEVEPHLSEEEQLSVTGGTLRTAYGIIEGRKRGISAEAPAERSLDRAA
jgi:hypothetical protein